MFVRVIGKFNIMLTSVYISVLDI